MKKYRQYSRDLSKKELENLRSKYKTHLQESKGGFLSTKQRKRLLGFKKRERGTPDSDFWWRIRKSTQDSIMDMQLICDRATEDELQEIFGEQEKISGSYPITNLIKALLPYELFLQRFKSDKEIEEIQIKQHWRKFILEEVIIEGLSWYYYSGIFTTKSHLDIIVYVMDAISQMGTGSMKFERLIPSGGIDMLQT